MPINCSNVRGFNYQPSFGRTANEIWLDKFDAGIIRSELAAGKRYFPGMNTVRLWLSHEPFLFGRDAFLEHFRKALDICHSLELQAIPALFNNWHSIPDFGGINPEMIGYWFQAFGQEGKAKNYVFRPYFETMFTQFESHPALFAWDMCNEPFNSNSPAIQPWLQDIYDSGKRLGVQTAIGVSVAAHPDHARKVDTCSDILMIHPYFAKDKTDLPELVQTYRA